MKPDPALDRRQNLEWLERQDWVLRQPLLGQCIEAAWITWFDFMDRRAVRQRISAPSLLTLEARDRPKKELDR